MPLVRIDILQGRSDAEVAELADVVHSVMLDCFAAPEGDRYQVITEHPPGRLLLEDTGLGFRRSDRMVLVSIVQQGRSTDQKRDTYRVLAQRLAERTGLDPRDLVVSVTSNTRADWSFGFGRAQFLEGDL